MQKRIAHITDTHLDDKSVTERGINPRNNLTQILEFLTQEGIDELVFTGDIGETDSYEWFFEVLDKYKPGFKLILGNHDKYQEVVKYYSHAAQGDGELFYTDEDEFYKYIYLDSSAGRISDQQLGWLKLEVTTNKKIILFIHHPILGVETGMDALYPLMNRDELAHILQQCKHEINVFAGHYHMPDKRRSGKIVQHITPAISFQIKKFSNTLEIKTDLFACRLIVLTPSAVASKLIINCYDHFIPSSL